MAGQIFALHGRATSLVIEDRGDGAPLWRYWGPRLADDFAAGPGLLDERPVPSFSLDEPVPFALFPTFGMGWFGQSGLLAHRDGLDFAQSFTGSRIERAGTTLTCELNDSVAGVEVKLAIALDPDCDVLTLSTELTNRGDAPLHVQWLSAAVLPLPPDARRVRHFSGRHNGEFVPHTDGLGAALWRKENRRGLTSHWGVPGAVVLVDDAGDHSGLAFGAQLAWSGNSLQQIELLDDGRRQWQLGEWLAPGEIRLAPGETLATPQVLATCSPDGLGGVAANFHTAMRGRLDWPGGAMRPRPVLLNTWEGYYFDHDPARLMQLAEAAASVGIERFVLDDGWFAGRDDDTRALGDWRPDSRKYPDGLAPLARHVTALGMEFGLWVEPEMVNPDSELLRAHPDWALAIADRPMVTARNQLVLDMAQPAVSEYLFGALATLLTDLPIAYLKWDHNRDLAPAADRRGHAAYHRQVAATYALLARLRAAFPEVEIESCAGGGGRIDAGILPYVHRFWTSDCIDALARVTMQRGFLQFMPPEIMGAHVGASPCHSTGRSFPIAFQAAVACQGHFGVELDLLKLDEADRAELAAWIAFAKEWRHLLHGGRIWNGAARDGVVWHAAGNRDEWLVIVYRTAPMQQAHASPVPLPHIAPGQFAVREIRPGDCGTVRHFDGSWLAAAGLAVPPGPPHSATIWHGVRR